MNNDKIIDQMMTITNGLRKGEEEGDFDISQDDKFQDALDNLDQTVDDLQAGKKLQPMKIYQSIIKANVGVSNVLDDDADFDQHYMRYADQLDDFQADYYNKGLTTKDRQKIQNEEKAEEQHQEDIKNQKNKRLDNKIKAHDKVIKTFKSDIESSDPKKYAKASELLDQHTDLRKVAHLDTSKTITQRLKRQLSQRNKPNGMADKIKLKLSRIKPHQMYIPEMAHQDILNPLPISQRKAYAIADNLITSHKGQYESILLSDDKKKIFRMPKEAQSKGIELASKRKQQSQDKVQKAINQYKHIKPHKIPLDGLQAAIMRKKEIKQAPALDTQGINVINRISNIAENRKKWDKTTISNIHKLSARALKYQLGDEHQSADKIFKLTLNPEHFKPNSGEKIESASFDLKVDASIIEKKRLGQRSIENQFNPQYNMRDVVKGMSPEKRSSFYIGEKSDLEKMRKSLPDSFKYKDSTKQMEELEKEPILRTRLGVAVAPSRKVDQDDILYNNKRQPITLKQLGTKIRSGIRHCNKDYRYVESLYYRKHMNKFVSSIQNHDRKAINKMTQSNAYFDTSDFSTTPTMFLRGDKESIHDIATETHSHDKTVDWNKVAKESKSLFKHTTKDFQSNNKYERNKKKLSLLENKVAKLKSSMNKHKKTLHHSNSFSKEIGTKSTTHTVERHNHHRTNRKRSLKMHQSKGLQR